MKKIKGLLYDCFGIIVLVTILFGALYFSCSPIKEKVDSAINEKLNDTIVPQKVDSITVIGVPNVKTDTIEIVKTIHAEAKDTIPLVKINDSYYIYANVNGLKMKFILDTGCSNVFIAESDLNFMLKHEYIKSTDFVTEQTSTIANGTQMKEKVYKLATLKIGKETIENIECGFGGETNETEALLGQSVLSRLGTVAIDYTNNRLLIY